MVVVAYFCEPNSFNGPVQLAPFDEAPLRISGDAARYNHPPEYIIISVAI
jgi:hypothetical protein